VNSSLARDIDRVEVARELFSMFEELPPKRDSPCEQTVNVSRFPP
jgi:hypothetical protein